MNITYIKYKNFNINICVLYIIYIIYMQVYIYNAGI